MQAHSGVQQDLTILATVVNGSASNFMLTVSGAFVFDRAGTAMYRPSSRGIDTLTLSASGLRESALKPVTPNSAFPNWNTSQPYLALRFDTQTTGKSAAVTTSNSATSLMAIQAAMVAARANATTTISSDVKGHEDLSEAATAMLTGCMWNMIYHPTQLGPFVTVSRAFTAQPYELFEWDTYFGATILSYTPQLLPLALSSMIQITKSKTMGPQLDGHGFVPGYSKGGRWLSEDRTERPVGAQTALRIFQRWHGVDGRDLLWVLQLLYSDLLDWHHWLWDFRRIEPLGLAGLGSDPCVVPNGSSRSSRSSPWTDAQPSKPLWCKPSWGMGQLQGARFESLDKSPMYDSPAGYNIWNATTHRMRVYDIGQSAAVVAECEALSIIAGLLGHDDDVPMLQARQVELSGLISKHIHVGEGSGCFQQRTAEWLCLPEDCADELLPDARRRRDGRAGVDDGT
jgi:hypothetical protein